MKKLTAVLMVTAMLSSALSGCAGAGRQTEVTVAAAKEGKDLSAMVWQGTVEALSSVDIIPAASGKVTQIMAKEGDHVEAGAALLEIDNQDASLQLEQAKAGYQAAQASFNSAQKANQQNTVVKPAQISFTTASDNFDRIKVLYASGDVSQTDYEAAKAQMDVAQVQLQAAQNNQTTTCEVTQAQLESAKAALDIAQKRYDDCMVVSPIKGLVTKISVETGQTVSPQIKAATVIDDSGKKVEIKVADMDIDQIKTGTEVNVNLQTLGESLKGSISDISAVSDSQTGMFDVTVSLGEESTNSAIGLMADIRIADNKEENSVYIPAKSVQSDDSGSYVYKVSDNSAVKAPVTLGKKKNAYIEVTNGLTTGDLVILQSSKPLTDGEKISILTVKQQDKTDKGEN
ncbi:efflux RND transporter periplasmic adaptor subunit [Lacrimispora amygdalina]|uniref:efflux RND transporter periplasmic adaptor subunit n=1 Tax=Lacrimispora amygdalina TaxID=253257 RepID=UPI000BE2920C|nr:efflux RND transporter periplasmic adaptor subunit [Lacrimispora amygdalina]